MTDKVFSLVDKVFSTTDKGLSTRDKVTGVTDKVLSTTDKGLSEPLPVPLRLPPGAERVSVPSGTSDAAGRGAGLRHGQRSRYSAGMKTTPFAELDAAYPLTPE